jgi:H+/Cl- antiporter ClcA
MFIKELNLYRHLIPGLIAASVGYAVYFAILHTSYLGIYDFPDFATLRVVDLGWALLVGIIAGLFGILFKIVLGLVHRVFGRLNKKPVIRAVIGALIIGSIGSFLPLTLYSGQDQLQEIVHNPAQFSIGILLVMLLVKILLTSTSFATGFEGGPIFPLLFVGGTLGQVLSGVLTFIPQGVGVLAGMAGATCAFLPIPLTVALLLGLFGGQTDLIPVIVIGAVTGYIISKILTPILQKHIPQPASRSKSSP